MHTYLYMYVCVCTYMRSRKKKQDFDVQNPLFKYSIRSITFTPTRPRILKIMRENCKLSPAFRIEKIYKIILYSNSNYKYQFNDEINNIFSRK